MTDSMRSGAGAATVTMAALAGCALFATAAVAQLQSDDQKKCINGLNKNGSKVASTRGKLDVACVKDAAKGDEPDATACLTADPDGKVQAAADKVTEFFTDSCTEAPNFGPTSAPTVISGAKDETIALATDLFGADVTGAIVLSSSNADAAKCQASIIGNVQKLANAVVKGFGACKSAGLKDDTIDTASRLQACINTVNADLKGKIAKAAEKLDDAMTDTCAGLDLDALFPGFCTDFSSPRDCILARARCRACNVLAVMDGLGVACDDFDDHVLSNASCGQELLATERVSLLDGVEPAETPGSPGVVVSNPKLLTQFPPSGPNLNRSDYVRWRLAGPDIAPDAILILVPGFGSGVGPLRTMAENLLPKILVDKDLRLEVWAFSRRDDLLEDREGVLIATAAQDPAIAQDWFYGAELGLTLDPALAAGPNRRALFYDAHADIPFLANFTPQVFSRDIDATVDAALAMTPNVYLGGHSAGTGFAARYAATDFNLSGFGPPDPGYAKLRGLVLFEGGGGTTAASAPLSADSIDRMIAKADGGLFGAVRDNAPRCVDGTTACTIATEASACSGQLPPKCTLPVTAYTSIGNLQPQIYAAGEVGAIQALRDPEYGQAILQVDQGSPGNNAIAVVPELALLAPPLVPDATVHGLFGIFLDDDGPTATALSPALATSMGEPGIAINGLAAWKDIDGDGTISFASRPNNGAAPTTLPAVRWGREVEVTRIDRHIQTFIAGGQNASDWYFAGSGLSTTSVTGECSSGACIVGKVGSCSVNSDCSQSISLDSSALSATRPDIANLTQASAINIPVISFGGSNGLTPVTGNYTAFGQSIGMCMAPICGGVVARVVDALLPNPAFPTFGGIAGGYEVYITEGLAHVDVITAEDNEDNLIPEQLEDFLERNLVP